MKFIYHMSFVVLLIISNSVLAQIKPIPQYIDEHYNAKAPTINIFTVVNDSALNAKYKSQVSSYTLVTITPSVLQAFVASNFQSANVVIPMPDNTTHNLQLVSNGFNNTNYNITLSGGGNSMVPSGINYRGIVDYNHKSMAAISFFNNDIIGVFSTKKYGDINIGKIKGEANLYIIYCEKDATHPPEFKCSTDELPASLKSPLNGQRIKQATNSHIGTLKTPNCIRMYLETDYALYTDKGSDANNVIVWVHGLFNVWAAVYQNESIKIEISELYLWDTQDNYTTATSIDPLNEFTALRQGYNGDLASLLALGGNNVGGIAYLDALCDPTSAFSYCNINNMFNPLPSYSWTVKMPIHEIGHNIGSNHTHWCGWAGGAIDDCGPTAGYPVEPDNFGNTCSLGPTPALGQGTIMSYCQHTIGVNLMNGFGPLPGALIRNKYNNASCLKSCMCTSFFVSTNTINATCESINNGSISTSITGGVAPFSFIWSNGDTTSDLTNVGPGSYTVDVRDAMGCFQIITDSVVSIISLNTTVTQPLCNYSTNGGISLAPNPAVGTYTYNWSTGDNTAAIDSLSAGIYYYTVTNDSGCTWQDTINLAASNFMTASIFQYSPPICVYDSNDLYAVVSGGNPYYKYHWDVYADTVLLQTTDTSLTNQSITNFILSTNQTYCLLTIDSLGCTVRDTLTINVLPPPPQFDKYQDSICSGSGLVVEPTASYPNIIYKVYDTNNNYIGNTPLFITTITDTTYMVVSYDSTFGCKSFPVNYHVIAKPLPTGILTVTDSACEYEGGVDIRLTSSMALDSVVILSDGQLIYSGIDDSTAYYFSGFTLGYHYFSAILYKDGCVGYSTMDTTKIITGVPITLSYADGKNGVCDKDTLKLIALPAGLISYSFAMPAILVEDSLIQDSTINTYATLQYTNGTYVYAYYGGIGCRGNADSIKVNVFKLPIVKVDTLPIVCKQDSVQLTAHCVTCLQYVWMPNTQLKNDSIIKTKALINGTITYTAIGIDANMCKARDSVTVIFSDHQVKTIHDTTIVYSYAINLVTTGDNISYKWTPQDSLSCNDCAVPYATIAEDITYIITATDKNNCITKDTVKIKVKIPENIFIPDVFSPNGDGENDVLYVRGESVIELIFVVYDRWGNIVYQANKSNNKSQGWDGIYNRHNAEEGVYVYFAKAKLVNGKEVSKKGDVTLIR